MFDLVHKNKRLVQIVIAIIMLPFAFFGVDYYFRGSDAKDQIAKVGEHAVSSQEFINALREQQDRIRQMSQGKATADMLNGPEIRNQVLESLVEQNLLLEAAKSSKIGISDGHLRELLHDIPVFQDEKGKFSPEKYKMLLGARGMSEGAFQARLRQDSVLQESVEAVTNTHFLSKSLIDRLGKIRAQQREISQAVISPANYLSQVTLEPNEAKAYYDKNTKLYSLPERARVEYVVFSMDSLLQNAQVSEADIQKYYKENMGRYERPEERHARHILIKVDAKASADDKAKAKAKAEAVLAQVKQNSAGFAEVAKRESQDVGSAGEGGDLGFRTRSTPSTAFDDTLFGMKSGDIAGPVETQFGFHLIKLEEIKAGTVRPLEEVRTEITEDVKKSGVGRLYAEKAEEFSSKVYEQSDSLKPAADALKLTVAQSGWITAGQAEPALLNNEKLLKVLFSADSVKFKRNTEAIEVAPNTLVSARVLEHIPSARQPFEVVQELIGEQLKANKAAEQAKKDGEDKIARLRKGEDAGLQWSPAQNVSREKPEGLSPEAAQVVFRADTSKLPGYAGFAGPDGRYVIFRLSKVTDATTTNAEEDKKLAGQISTMLGREAHAARMKSLREKSKVIINKERLDRG